MITYLSPRALLLPLSNIAVRNRGTTPRFLYSAKMAEKEAPKAEALPPLNRQDRDTYDRMAQTMNMFHNSFRSTWKILYGACSSGKRPANMSIRQFINTGCDFCHHLHMHHSIEEQHIFPVLAQRMPAFRKELELLTQHKEIHKGMDKMEVYLDECKAGKRDLQMGELKQIMESFETVLWEHLDDEVEQLSPENLRKYWSLDEVKRLPM